MMNDHELFRGEKHCGEKERKKEREREREKRNCDSIKYFGN